MSDLDSLSNHEKSARHPLSGTNGPTYASILIANTEVKSRSHSDLDIEAFTDATGQGTKAISSLVSRLGQRCQAKRPPLKHTRSPPWGYSAHWSTMPYTAWQRTDFQICRRYRGARPIWIFRSAGLTRSGWAEVISGEGRGDNGVRRVG